MIEIVNFESKLMEKIEEDITNALSNRCGMWVSESFLHMVASKSTTPNVVTFGHILKSMISKGKIEKTFQTATDKFDRTVHLPQYRLMVDFDDVSL